MDLRQLRYFVAVARHGSLSRAAEQLHIVQPALTAQIKSLEAELGASLFDRHPKGVWLNAAGQQALRQAQEVLTQAERLKTMFGQEGGPSTARQTIRVGLPNSVTGPVTQALIQRVGHELPRVSLEIVEGMSGFLLEWLRAGRIDLAVLFDNQTLTRMDVAPLVSENLMLVGPSGELDPAQPVPMAALPRYPMLLNSKRHGLGQLIARSTSQAGVRLKTTARVDSVTEIRRLIQRGAGYSILAPIIVAEDLRAGRLSAAPIVDPGIVRTLVTATSLPRRGGAALPLPAVRALLHELWPASGQCAVTAPA